MGGGGGGALVKRPGHGGGKGGMGLSQSTAPLIPDTSYFESRAEAVSEIEAHIVELGTVFNRLGELVQDHQELTERLHENVNACLASRLVVFPSKRDRQEAGRQAGRQAGKMDGGKDGWMGNGGLGSKTRHR